MRNWNSFLRLGKTSNVHRLGSRWKFISVHVYRPSGRDELLLSRVSRCTMFLHLHAIKTPSAAGTVVLEVVLGVLGDGVVTLRSCELATIPLHCCCRAGVGWRTAIQPETGVDCLTIVRRRPFSFRGMVVESSTKEEIGCRSVSISSGRGWGWGPGPNSSIWCRLSSALLSEARELGVFIRCLCC